MGIAIIDGLLSNYIQIELMNTSLNKDLKNESKFKFQAMICFLMIIFSFYLLYCLCFDNFLHLFINDQILTPKTRSKKVNDTDESHKKSSIRLFFFEFLPILFLIYLALFTIIILMSDKIYAPSKELYHLEPPLISNQIQDQNIFKTGFKSLKKQLKSFSILKPSEHNEDIDENLNSNRNKFNANTDQLIKFENLPWKIVNLSDSECFELKVKYSKFIFFCSVTIFLYILLIINFNLCGFLRKICCKKKN